jgi:uncharacterized protein
MTSPDFQQAWQYAENRLERELPSQLLYHGVSHTREEVVPAAERLAGMEGLQGVLHHLLLTSAWFHDIGHVEQSKYHELIGARIAVKVLPSFGFAEDQVETVRWAILATILPQAPHSPLEEILADADLDGLGRENFMQRNDDLRQELAFLGERFTDDQWYQRQVRFLEAHKFFTASAHSLRDTQKSLNLAELRKTLQELRSRD